MDCQGDTVTFLHYVSGFLLVVEPGESFDPALVTVVGVCLHSIGLDKELVKLADCGLFIVQLQSTQIGQHLTLLGVLFFPAADGRLVVVVAEEV